MILKANCVRDTIAAIDSLTDNPELTASNRTELRDIHNRQTQ